MLANSAGNFKALIIQKERLSINSGNCYVFVCEYNSVNLCIGVCMHTHSCVHTGCVCVCLWTRECVRVLYVHTPYGDPHSLIQCYTFSRLMFTASNLRVKDFHVAPHSVTIHKREPWETMCCWGSCNSISTLSHPF